MLKAPLMILSWLFEFLFAGGSNEYSGRAVFGFVEKAEVKRIQQSQRVSIGSSGGDDGMVEPSQEGFHVSLFPQKAKGYNSPCTNRQ